MASRRKNRAEKTAAAKPASSQKTEQEGGAAPPAAPDVAEHGASALEAAGSEHQAGEAGAPEQDLGDVKDGDRQTAADAGDQADHDGDAGDAGQSGDTGGAGEGGGASGGSAGGDDAGSGGDPATADGATGAPGVQQTDPDGNQPSDAAPDEPDLDHVPMTLDQVALCGAIGAYQEALTHGAWLGAVISGAELLDPETTDDVYAEMASFVRQIGDRATPEVLAQQLLIKKHRQSAEISEPERIAFHAFSSVLMGLDRFVAAEQAGIARKNAPAEVAPPVPIDDTTLEMVDGPLDTWGQN